MRPFRARCVAATLTGQKHVDAWLDSLLASPSVTVRIARFLGEYAQLSAWTGEPVDQLQAEEDYHSEDREHWLAWDSDAVVGVLHPWRAPDGRMRLYYDKCRPDTYAPLASAIAGPCFTTVGSADTAALTALTAAGFMEHRRENLYEIPVSRTEPPVPTDIEIVTADKTELWPLMLLDCAIRADIPGADGWQPDPVWFREETYDSPFFDPQTYRVALHGSRYVGLARVWKPGPGEPYGRLGCVGVLADYRRRGLARALIAQAFAPLAEAGAVVVGAEADATNIASHTLLTSFGGRIIGATIELYRP
jgi:ribosomal protein S18 acetylase RimI-like enzyme